MGIPRYTQHLIFWLCNSKTVKLYFRRFNTNSKKFAVTVNCMQIETKRLQNCRKLSEGHLNVSDHFRRLPKISEKKSKNVSIV